MNRKITSCCTLCDQEMYEVSVRWPDGHPYAGEPREVGRPLGAVVRYVFVQTNGKLAWISFCETCGTFSWQRIVEIWRKILAAFEYETRHRAAIGMQPLDEKQREANAAMLRELVANPIVGIVAIQRIEL